MSFDDTTVTLPPVRLEDAPTEELPPVTATQKMPPVAATQEMPAIVPTPPSGLQRTKNWWVANFVWVLYFAAMAVCGLAIGVPDSVRDAATPDVFAQNPPAAAQPDMPPKDTTRQPTTPQDVREGPANMQFTPQPTVVSTNESPRASASVSTEPSASVSTTSSSPSPSPTDTTPEKGNETTPAPSASAPPASPSPSPTVSQAPEETPSSSPAPDTTDPVVEAEVGATP